VTIAPLNENAALVSFGNVITLETNRRVVALHHALRQHPFDGFVESVPAYSSLAVFYNPLRVPRANPNAATAFGQVEILIEALLNETALPDTQAPVSVEIPVLYDGEDLTAVAAFHGQTVEDTIALHVANTYRVFMIGFLPGFAYLGTLDDRLATPRRATPRTAVPPGSVGIAGHQTGIYPSASPGGWQLIGRTPFSIFSPHRQPPCLLSPGDSVRFYAIDREEFDRRHEH